MQRVQIKTEAKGIKSYPCYAKKDEYDQHLTRQVKQNFSFVVAPLTELEYQQRATDSDRRFVRDSFLYERLFGTIHSSNRFLTRNESRDFFPPPTHKHILSLHNLKGVRALRLLRLYVFKHLTSHFFTVCNFRSRFICCCTCAVSESFKGEMYSECVRHKNIKPNQVISNTVLFFFLITSSMFAFHYFISFYFIYFLLQVAMYKLL